MTLSGLQALGVLAGAIYLFLRFCTIDECDHSSPSAGSAGSQGEGGAETPNLRAPCRDEVQP